MALLDYFENLKTKVDYSLLEGIDTIINFDLKGGESKHLIVKDKTMTVGDGINDGAEVTLTAKEDDLMSIINGDTNPMMAMMSGKLKISNPGAMMKYAKLLGLM